MTKIKKQLYKTKNSMNSKRKNIVKKENILSISNDSKIISYSNVKLFLDYFTDAFTSYGNYMYNKYNQEIDDQNFTKLMRNSYLQNVRYLINPNWNDMNVDFEYPNYHTMDGINEIFYAISEKEQNLWLFQTISENYEGLNDETIIGSFEALINNIYHTEFMTNNDTNYHRFYFYFNMFKYMFDKNKSGDNTSMIYHIGSVLRIDDNKSSLHLEYNPLESCIATKNMLMAINSFNTLHTCNITTVLESIHFEKNDIKTYINCILLPFVSSCYAIHHLNMEDELITIDSTVVSNTCTINPHSSWFDKEDDVSDNEYKQYVIETERVRKAMLNLKKEEESRKRKEFDAIPINYTIEPPQLLNTRFIQKLEEDSKSLKTPIMKSNPTNSKADAFETSSVSSSTVSITTNKHTYINHDFIFEGTNIPRSIMRNIKNNTAGPDNGFLIFHYSSAFDHVYGREAVSTHRGKYKCSMKNLCNELPRLLVEKEHLLRKSVDKVFGKSLEELFQTDIQTKKLYYTNIRRAIISLCNEISVTDINDNNGRMNILEKYYGPRKADETDKMYINSFIFDVFRPFINFYNYVKNIV